MKITKSDFTVMRSSLITLTIAICCSLLLIYFSDRQASIAERNWSTAQQRLSTAKNELNNARWDYENLFKYQDEYAASLDRNLIGEEPRLDWVESLERLRQQGLVSDMHYNIGPQKTYTPQMPIDSGNFDIKYSEMKLQLDLLHEGQLIDYFDALRTQIKGWYQLDECNIVRTNSDKQNVAIQLRAECSGGWITLKNRSAP